MIHDVVQRTEKGNVIIDRRLEHEDGPQSPCTQPGEETQDPPSVPVRGRKRAEVPDHHGGSNGSISSRHVHKSNSRSRTWHALVKSARIERRRGEKRRFNAPAHAHTCLRTARYHPRPDNRRTALR